MHIAIVTAQGFNELDSFIALGILNRVRQPGWKVSICAPSESVTSLVLARLGLLQDIPACTDLMTKPWVLEAGVEVLEQPFFASGNVATAGGCLSSQYLATWVIARTQGVEAARSAMHYVAPVGEKDSYVKRALSHVQPYLSEAPKVQAA